MPPPDPLDTPRLRLVPTRVEHAAALLPIWGNPDLLGHYLREVCGSLEECTAVVRRMASIHDGDEGYRWSMILSDRNEVIGTLGYHAWNRKTATADLSYEVVPARWGKGYATEAARAAIDYGFTSMGLACIVANVARVNTPSVRVLERLGFRLAGEGLRCWGDREMPFLTFRLSAP